MAELDSSNRSNINQGAEVRARKANIKVDLTAMVDLAFLLITFFMLTTSLSKPMAMDIAKPDEEVQKNNYLDLRASQTMTILLGKHDKVAWYMGEPGKNQPVMEGFNEIRKSILQNKKKVAEVFNHDPKKTLVVLIKPTSGSKYKNFVDIMDELNLTKITNAPIIDDDQIFNSEVDFMKENGIL
jgi:biopolymer transport protein ExbD